MTNDTHGLKSTIFANNVTNSLTEQMVESIANATLLSPTAKTQYLVQAALRTKQHFYVAMDLA